MSEFNLKSGNTTPFKMMGSSPAKQKPKYPGQAEESKIKSKSQIEYEKEMYPTGKKDK